MEIGEILSTGKSPDESYFSPPISPVKSHIWTISCVKTSVRANDTLAYITRPAPPATPAWELCCQLVRDILIATTFRVSQKLQVLFLVMTRVLFKNEKVKS